MPRTIFLGANWKMHKIPEGACGEESPFHSRNNVHIVVFPTLFDLAACKQSNLFIGAQHARAEKSGAFTGDVSIEMIKEHGCTYVLCGHSEQRKNYREKDAEIWRQVNAAADTGITPILCIGEAQEERQKNLAEEVLSRQIPKGLPKDTIIAYEPCWAIGNGKTASCNDIQHAHAYIRGIVGTNHRIIYGGSVNAENAEKILLLPNVDGLLIGNASLDPKVFQKIVEMTEKVAI